MADRGMIWNQEETEFLLDVYGNKETQTQMVTAGKRNQEVWMRVANLMAAVGYSRDWQQCRDKIKRLKMEYRASNDLFQTNSETAATKSRNFKFYDKVAAILKLNAELQAARNLEFREIMVEEDAEESIPVSHIKVEQLSPERDELLPLPPQASECSSMLEKNSERGVIWSYDEVDALVEIWAQEHIQRELNNNAHNRHVYEAMADLLRDRGYYRSPQQCRIKIKKLKREYLLNGGRIKKFNNFSNRVAAAFKASAHSRDSSAIKWCNPQPETSERISRIEETDDDSTILSEPSGHCEETPIDTNNLNIPTSSNNNEEKEFTLGPFMERMLDRFFSFQRETETMFFEFEEKRLRLEAEIMERRRSEERKYCQQQFECFSRMMTTLAKEGISSLTNSKESFKPVIIDTRSEASQ